MEKKIIITKQLIFFLCFCVFIVLIDRYGDNVTIKENRKLLDKIFTGVVLEHNDYRTFRLKLNLFQPDVIIEMTDVSQDLYNYAERGDTIVKKEIGNRCLLIKKDTSYVIDCYVILGK